jgi:hypothetical protein
MRLLRIEPLVRYHASHRQVVRVRHPAYRIGVVAMAVGELRRTPAVDRLADELLGADQETEADENDDRLLAAEPIDVIVVDSKLDLVDAQHRFEQAIHLFGESFQLLMPILIQRPCLLHLSVYEYFDFFSMLDSPSHSAVLLESPQPRSTVARR